MNSLPFIPHHLFVEAIGNDGRACQRPTRPGPRFVEPAGPANALSLEVMDSRKPMAADAIRSLQVSVIPARP